MLIRLKKSSLKKIQETLNPELTGLVVKTGRACPKCGDPIYQKKGRGRPRALSCGKWECSRKHDREYMKVYMRGYKKGQRRRAQ